MRVKAWIKNRFLFALSFGITEAREQIDVEETVHVFTLTPTLSLRERELSCCFFITCGKESAISTESFKFIHAANLFLNHQLVGTGSLSDDSQRIVQQATIAAFHHLVEEAVNWEVNFVLLVGNSFDETDESLGSRVELLNGLGFLHDANIPTIVLPGEADSYDTWNNIAGLPDSVTLIDPRDLDLVSIKNNNEQIASIGMLSSFQKEASATSFQIALTTSDEIDDALTSQCDSRNIHYLAMGGKIRQTEQTTSTTLHAPGGTQGLTAVDVGEHGCSLVEVNNRQQIDIMFLPTAAVRRETIEIETGRQANVESLGSMMRQALDNILHSPCEQLWLLHWTFYNSGSLSALMQDDNTDELLSQAIRNGVSIPKELRLESTYQLLPDQNTINLLSQRSPLAASYFEGIDQTTETLPHQLQQLLAISGLEESNRTEQLGELIDNLNPNNISAQAQQLGLKWFRSITSPETEWND